MAKPTERTGDGDPAALISDAMETLAAAAALVDSRTAPQQMERCEQLMSPGAVLGALIGGTKVADPANLGVPIRGGRLIAIRAEFPGLFASLLQKAQLPPHIISAHTGAEWLLLVPRQPGATGHDVAARDAVRILEYLQRLGTVLWNAGISASLRSSDEIPAAYRDATDAAALAAREKRSIIAVDDEWARLTCERLRTAVRSALPANCPLNALADYDEAHSTTFGDTLGTWLAYAGDTVATATELFIHPNTLRYRLRRAAGIAGLDLDDQHQRLVLMLTLWM